MKFVAHLKEKVPHEVKYILSLFFVTRIALTFIGVVSRMLIQPIYQGSVGYHSKYFWLNIWGVWDTAWYTSIARNWYSFYVNEQGYANYGFFPLYPLLMRFLGFLLGDFYLAGLLVSNVSLIVACVFLYRLVFLDYGGDTALRSVKYLFLFPTAFILSGVFSESLFLALLVMCFYYARKGMWFLVGVLGFLLSLTKPHGVFMTLPLLYEYLKAREFRLKNVGLNILFSTHIILGLLVYSAYSYYLTGDLLAYVHVKEMSWGHTLSNPFEILYTCMLAQEIPILFNGLFGVAVILLLSLFHKKIGFSYWLQGMLILFVPLISGLPAVPSIPRYTLLIFPVYILFARLTEKHDLDQVITVPLVLLQGFLMVFWTNGFPLII